MGRLSPFVSPNRSADYYPVFMALSVRSIPIRAYVRPRAEQPETLRPTYADAVRNLELRGVQVLCRPGMHEKVAAIDGRILWHGSLNILFHNDSRESMLRFDCPELAIEILQDLGIDTVLDAPSSTSTESQDQAPGPDMSLPRCKCSVLLWRRTTADAAIAAQLAATPNPWTEAAVNRYPYRSAA